MKKTSKKDSSSQIELEIKNSLGQILEGIKVEATVEVAKEEENYRVNIQTQDTGLMIGHHGETINALQLLLGIILYKKLGNWVRVVVDVGDYRKDREANIKQMVERIVAEVESAGNPVALPYLTPYERRIVHMMLADHPKAISESVGEGKDRRVNIKLRQTV